jgi:hypothetical protein
MGKASFWDMLRRERLNGENSQIWLELDLYESAGSIVERAMKGNDTDAMRELAMSGEPSFLHIELNLTSGTSGGTSSALLLNGEYPEESCRS